MEIDIKDLNIALGTLNIASDDIATQNMVDVNSDTMDDLPTDRVINTNEDEASLTEPASTTTDSIDSDNDSDDSDNADSDSDDNDNAISTSNVNDTAVPCCPDLKTSVKMECNPCFAAYFSDLVNLKGIDSKLTWRLIEQKQYKLFRTMCNEYFYFLIPNDDRFDAEQYYEYIRNTKNECLLFINDVSFYAADKANIAFLKIMEDYVSRWLKDFNCTHDKYSDLCMDRVKELIDQHVLGLCNDIIRRSDNYKGLRFMMTTYEDVLTDNDIKRLAELAAECNRPRCFSIINNHIIKVIYDDTVSMVELMSMARIACRYDRPHMLAKIKKRGLPKNQIMRLLKTLDAKKCKALLKTL